MPIQLYSGNEPYIFISYAHKDADTVLPIITALQDAGFRIWYDAGIEVGTEWPEIIAGHLKDAARVITFISPSFVDSQNCRREVNFAVDLNKEPIAVYLENFTLTLGMRMQLGTLQALYYDNHPDFDSFINTLIRVKDLQVCRDSIDLTNPDAIEQELRSLIEKKIFHTAIAYADRVLRLDEKNAVAYRYRLLAELEITNEGELALQNTPLDTMLTYQNFIRYADADAAERFERYNRAIRERLFGEERQMRAKEKREMAEMAKEQVSTLLISQNAEAISLEAELNVKEAELRKKSDPKRVKIFSVLLVVLGVLDILFFVISMYLNINDIGQNFTVFVILTWAFLLVAYPIMTLIHCIVLKREFYLWLLNLVTLFMFSFFWSVSMLTALPKQKALAEEIDIKKKRLSGLREEIAANEKRLKEVEEALRLNEF